MPATGIVTRPVWTLLFRGVPKPIRALELLGHRWTPSRHGVRGRGQAAISIKRFTTSPPPSDARIGRNVDFSDKVATPVFKKRGSRGFGWRPASTSGLPRCLCRVLAFALNSRRSGEYLRGGARASTESAGRTRPKRSGSMWLLGLVTASDADAADHRDQNHFRDPPGITWPSSSSASPMFRSDCWRSFWSYLRKERFRPERLSYDPGRGRRLAFALTTDLAILVQLTLVTGASPSLTSLVAWAEFALLSRLFRFFLFGRCREALR